MVADPIIFHIQIQHFSINVDQIFKAYEVSQI